MRIILNVVTLTIWQGSVYLIPLITTPYLARVLGVEQFGLLGIAGAAVSYVSLVSDWGFSLSATQRAARNASKPEELRRLFWDVVLAKALLACAAVGIILALIPAFSDSGAVLPIALAYLLQVLFSVANASWLLQGLERMVGFAAASLAGRILTVPLTFAFVHSPDDAVIAAAIQGGTFLASTVASLYAASRVIPLRPIELSLSRSWRQIREGSSLFLSTGGISLYSQSNIIVLGAVGGALEAGLYSGADRVRRAIQGVTSPISTALFPRVNHLVVTNPGRARQLVAVMLLVQGGGTLVLSLTLFFFAELIVVTFLGADFKGAVQLVEILAPIPFLVGVSNVFGMQMMLPFGFSRDFTSITAGSGLFSLILLAPLCHIYGAAGAAITATLTEALVTVAMGTVLFAGRARLFLDPAEAAAVAKAVGKL